MHFCGRILGLILLNLGSVGKLISLQVLNSH